MGLDEATLAAMMGVLAVFGIIALVWVVIAIVANWRIFTKAGQPGWKCIIPYYNTYTQLEFTWSTSVFWVYLVISIVSAVLQRMEKGGMVSLLSMLVGLAAIVLWVMMMHKLSKAFGHGVGFTLGLIFLNPIFLLILAFGSSEYEGIPD